MLQIIDDIRLEAGRDLLVDWRRLLRSCRKLSRRCSGCARRSDRYGAFRLIGTALQKSGQRNSNAFVRTTSDTLAFWKNGDPVAERRRAMTGQIGWPVRVKDGLPGNSGNTPMAATIT